MTQDALTALQEAVRVNPSAIVPRNTLLKYLTDNRLYDQAYELTSKSIRYSPNDADLLVDHGILANHLGHSQEALDAWKRALAIDPAQTRAHLYLADELSKQNQPATAVPHYVMYLDQIGTANPRPQARETAR